MWDILPVVNVFFRVPKGWGKMWVKVKIELFWRLWKVANLMLEQHDWQIIWHDMKLIKLGFCAPRECFHMKNLVPREFAFMSGLQICISTSCSTCYMGKSSCHCNARVNENGDKMSHFYQQVRMVHFRLFQNKLCRHKIPTINQYEDIYS